MKSHRSEFKLIDRGFKDTILLIPGWATDYRIFGSLNLDFNYLLPVLFSLNGFEDALVRYLKTVLLLNKISILGWSMGGYLAADFASRHQDCVNDVTLIGMRGRYGVQDIEKVKNFVMSNKNAYVYKFYSECFSSGEEERQALSFLKSSLVKIYLKSLSVDELLRGLDYLGRAYLDSAKLKNVQIRFIHGEDDKVVPLSQIVEIKEVFPDTELIIVKGAGHALFLRKDFKDIFYGKQDR